MRLALRTLARDPWFAAWVILSLALSLGAVASVFSIADRLLLRPPAGIAGAERVGRVSARSVDAASGSGFDQSAFSYPAYEAARGRTRGRVELAAFTLPGPAAVARPGGVLQARVSTVSGNYFRALGVRPAAGTLFGAADDRPGAAPVAVVSATLARRLGGDGRAIVGRPIRIDQRFYTVVGIAGGGFVGTEVTPTDAWIPLRAAGEAAFGERWTANSAIYPLTLVGRRAAGVDPAVASQVVLAGLAAEPPSDSRSIRYLSTRFDPLLAARGPSPSGQARLTLWLAATALAMLVVASINTATLYLARGRRRARDLAVSMALGASPGRIARSQVAEGLVLTAAGTALGLAVAQWSAGLLRTLVLPRVAWDGSLVDLRIAAATALLALLVALGSSLVPALRSSAIDPATCVRDAPAAGRGVGRTWRFALHAVQAAFSAALLVSTGLFLRSSLLASRLHLGFEPRGLYAVTGEYAPDAVAPAVVEQAFARLRERVARAPGIEAVELASTAPMISTAVSLVYPEGAPEDAAGALEGPFVVAAGPGYLAVTATRLVRGRGMDAAERGGGVLINQTAAARLWPGGSALGRCLRLDAPDAPCRPVVGITEDGVRQAITDPPAFQVFAPLEVFPGRRVLLVRAKEGHGDVAAMLRPVLADAFPASITPAVRSIQQVTAGQSALWRSGAALFTLLGGLMVLLAALGLYGSLTYLAAARRYEFGVRIALGERPERIALSFVRFGLLVTATGLVAGLGLLRVGERFLQPLLFHTAVFDPGVIAGVSLLLAIVAVAATVRPALAAARTDPMSLLRGDIR